MVAFGLVFLVAGVAVIYFGISGALTAMGIADAVESTQGTVTSSGVEEVTESDGEEREVEYVPRVRYEYTVDGTSHEGRWVYAPIDRERQENTREGRGFDSRADARDVVDDYRPGETVTVYYFPDDPSRSFLVKPGVDVLAVGFMAAFGLVFVLIGGGAVVAALFDEVGDADADIDAEFEE